MEYKLSNGNLLSVTHKRVYSDVESTKVYFEYKVMQKDGNWVENLEETISLSTYASVEDYIETNYEVV